MNKKNTIESNLKIILCSIIIITIGQISYMNSSEGLAIVALLVCVFFSGILPIESLFPLMLCILPANRLLTYGPISAPTVIMLIALFRIVRTLVHIQKQVFGLCAMLIGYSTLTLFGGGKVFFDSIKIVVMLLFIYKCVDVSSIKISHYRYTIFCAIGCIFTSLIVLISNPASIIESSRFTFSKNGENVLGIMCAVIAINLFILLLEKKTSKRIMLIILVILLLGIGFMTGSRSFMLAVVIGIIGIIIMLILRMQVCSLLKTIALLVIGLIGAIFLVKTSDFINNYWNSIVYRVTKLQTVDVSNGRYEIWREYIEAFHQHPNYLWFGGLSVGTNGIKLEAHNMIIEQIAAYGIIGSVILVPLYYIIFKRIICESSSSVMWNTYRIVPLIVLLSISMVSHTLLGVPQTTMLFLCLFALLDDEYKNIMEV